MNSSLGKRSLSNFLQKMFVFTSVFRLPSTVISCEGRASASGTVYGYTNTTGDEGSARRHGVPTFHSINGTQTEEIAVSCMVESHREMTKPMDEAKMANGSADAKQEVDSQSSSETVKVETGSQANHTANGDSKAEGKENLAKSSSKTEEKGKKTPQVAATPTDEAGTPAKLKNSLSTQQKVELQTRLVPAIEDIVRRFAKTNRVSTTSVWKHIGLQGRELRKKSANAWNNFRRLEGPLLSNQGHTSQEVCNILALRYRALSKDEREVYRLKDVESSEDSGEDVELDDPFSDIDEENTAQLESLKAAGITQEPGMADGVKPEDASKKRKIVIGSRTLSKMESATQDIANHLHYLDEFYGIQGMTILTSTENLDNNGQKTSHVPISVTIGGPLAHKFDDAHKGTLRRNWREYVNAKKRKLAHDALPDEQ